MRNLDPYEVFHAEPRGNNGAFLHAPEIHVGTLRAALDRARSRYDGAATIWNGYIPIRSVTIGPLISDSDVNIGDLSGQRSYDVTPYINVFEDPGSISFVLHPLAVQRWRPIKVVA